MIDMIEQIHRLSINYLCKKQYEKKTIEHITCLKMTNNSLAWSIYALALHEGKSIKPPQNKLRQHKHVNIKQNDSN